MVRCYWVVRKIGGAVWRHHSRPNKWVGRGAAHHTHHHAAGAKVVKILVCIAGGVGIGGASQWGSGSTAGAALPPPAYYSEIPGLESGWFGLPGSVLASAPGLFSDVLVPGETLVTFNRPPLLSASPEVEAMGGSPTARGTVHERVPGTIERPVPVSEPGSTIKLLLTAVTALLFLGVAKWSRQ